MLHSMKRLKMRTVTAKVFINLNKVMATKYLEPSKCLNSKISFLIVFEVGFYCLLFSLLGGLLIMGFGFKQSSKQSQMPEE